MKLFLQLCYGLVYLFASSSLAGSIEPGKPDIVNGTNAYPGQFPYIVSLQFYPAFHSCGGSLLNSYQILTAAHCFVDQQGKISNPSSQAARAATLFYAHGGVQIQLSKLHIHPDYDPVTSFHDIAIADLIYPMPEGIPFVSLPQPGLIEPIGTPVTLAGWGDEYFGQKQGTSQLQTITIPVTNVTQCREVYGNQLTAHEFCVGLPQGGQSTCQGDSGGPGVLSNGTIVGLVSRARGCAHPDFPTILTKVSSYLNYIKSITG